MSVSLSSRGFVEVAKERGVTVYRNKRSKQIHLAAEGVIPMPPELVESAILDYERHPKINEAVAESRVLTRGSSTQLVYQRLDIPVISDRDYVLRVEWGRDGDERWIEYQAVEGVMGAETPRRGIVRLKDHRGSWQLRPIENGKATFARYEMQIDLAGWVPGWMSRGRAGEDIPQLFEGMRRLALEQAGDAGS